MHQKFKDIYVAVDAKRVRGIDHLQNDGETKDVDVVLLDDAFQHRYVKPGINILLVDYHRLIIYDKMMPAGRLREPLSGKNRADIVIITKCPKDLKPMEFRVLTKAMNLYTAAYAARYRNGREEAIEPYLRTAEAARELGLGLNAGHDLSLENLSYFIHTIPWTDEVSIGHAIICDALYMGLETTIGKYLSEINNF